MQKKRVLVIGLDAAEPLLIDRWVSQGYLKNLKYLRENGVTGNLSNIPYHDPENLWNTCLTGRFPENTGYWAPFKFRPDSYDINRIQASNPQEYPPFYALADSYQVVAFDQPNAVLSDNCHGLQVIGWGTHGPREGIVGSLPEPLLGELINLYGEHPALHNDVFGWWDREGLEQLQRNLTTGVERRVAICQDLLQRNDWDLFFTTFGESHAASHILWGFEDSSHPLYPHLQGKLDVQEPMQEIFSAIDAGIGQLLAAVDDETAVVIFSPNGMDANASDIPNMVVLPEFLYRFSFSHPLSLQQGSREISPMITSPSQQRWSQAIWQAIQSPDSLSVASLEKLAAPRQLRQQGQLLSWMPILWYRPFWPQMSAFALSSFLAGHIRINLQGRETSGIVAPEAYGKLCDELTAQLHQLKNARTGKPVVKEVVPTRKNATEDDQNLPDADLIVLWEDNPTDVFDHPQFGRFGPVPYFRTGGHSARGFVTIKAPGIQTNSTLPTGRVVDLAPTILELMGIPIPATLDGQSLLT